MAILAYAAKYCSGFYGPFREAAESTPKFGDRRSYQMDPSNAREALREVALDLEEGADMVMVKPALSISRRHSAGARQFRRAMAAYNVSGEYAHGQSGGRNGWLDEQRMVLEILTSIQRAGADISSPITRKTSAAGSKRNAVALAQAERPVMDLRGRFHAQCRVYPQLNVSFARATYSGLICTLRNFTTPAPY